MKRFILAIILTVAAAAPTLPQTQPGKLANAIQEGKRAAAFSMIQAGVDVNEAQPDGTRPIHWAVYRVDYDLAAALVAKKAKVDVANEFGYTPLAEAVKQGDARMVKLLMDAGSGTEAPNLDGQTALMVAIKNGDLAIFQMLINAGAKVNVVEKAQDQTPLMWAAAAPRNGAEMVKALIAKGAKVNERAKVTDWPSQITSEPRAQYHSYGGLTPLLYAARSGCYGCVEALVGAAADVNLPSAPEGITALMVALDNTNNGVAKYLMEHGANPNLWDVYGRTALYIAVDHAAGAAAAAGGGGGGGARGGAGGGGGRGGAGGPGAPGAAAAPGGAPALPAAGAAPAAAAAQGGRGGGGGQGGGGRGGAGGGQGGRGGGGRAGAGADAGPQVSSMEIINLLLAAGVDPNAQLNMRRLLGQGGRFSDPLLSSGTTPLMRAMVNNNMEVAKLLLEKGADPNIYGMGLSPWLYAAGLTSQTYNEARGGGGQVNTETLDLMLKHGADINAQVYGAASYSGRIARALTGDPVNTKSNEGMTALHVAVRSQNASLVKYLLDHGARVDIVDASERTPMDVLNGKTALVPAVFADAEGVVPRNAPNPAAAAAPPATPAAPPAGAGARGGGGGGGAGGRGAGNPAAVQEIRTLLQTAAQSQKK